MIALCFLAWISLGGMSPYCDCWQFTLPHCYGQPNPYADCVVRF